MASSSFIHLRTHSAYSLAEGAIKLPDLVGLAVQQKMPALALTDSNNLFGALEFSKACSDKGVQPIIGCVVVIEAATSSAARGAYKTPFASAPVLDTMVLLAKDAEGYSNLLYLMSKAYIETPDHELPHIKLADIAQEGRSNGLIALTGGPKGPMGRMILEGRPNDAETMLVYLQQLFGDRLYIELMRHGEEAEERIEPTLLKLAYAYGVPLVATNDVYFAHRDMYEAHDALLCIAEGRLVAESDRRKLTPEYYFKTAEEMQQLFADIPEAIANTVVIAKRCAVKAEEHAPILPRFDNGEGKDEATLLREEAEAGLQKRLDNDVFTADMAEQEKQKIIQTYHDRLHFELDVIIGMQFPGYFLIVSDFIRWSKKHGIPVGPGRGSGAGSVVAWSLDITDLDPIRFGLLFERFLNPERISMPDFDIDFCQERRDEVIQYVQQKYGKKRVAQIITIGKLQARIVIRDVGRVLQMPQVVINRIAGLIPNNPAKPITLAEAIAMEPLLQEAQQEDPEVAKWLTIALQLEGLNRHASTHAAGVVIADRDLEALVPLYRDPRSTMPVIQYSMKYAEAAGLVKFDFLGLKTLTVVADTCKLLQTRGITVDITHIPFNDPATFAMLSRGETVGVFQFESAGMRDALRKMKPDCIEDLIALGALYRPGPMDNIPTYIACKHGLEDPDYLHPKLEGILKETFGVIIYQEQVMQIAQVLSGYTLGAADLLRRAMGKKIKSEMDAQRELFVSGAIQNGVDKAQASSIFDLVAKFAGYGFNKSHAAAYALISYQTAYLKANYPVDFLIASMNLELHDTDKLNGFFQEARARGVPVLPVAINASQALFSFETVTEKGKEQGAIRYGLGAVKNVGVETMVEVVKERSCHGPFATIYDFLKRAEGKLGNKRMLEQLIKAGALDGLEANRKKLYDASELLMRYQQEATKGKASNQLSFFDLAGAAMPDIAPVLPETTDWPEAERVQYEKEAIGFYLLSHPLNAYQTALKKCGIRPASSIENLPNGTERLKLAGVVTEIRVKFSAKGRFAYLYLSDSSAMFEVAIFNEELLTSTRHFLEPGTLVYVVVEAKKDEGGARLIADTIMPLQDIILQQRAAMTVWMNGEDVDAGVQGVQALKQLCQSAGNGRTKLTVMVRLAEEIVMLELPGDYALTPDMLTPLQSQKGIEKVEC